MSKAGLERFDYELLTLAVAVGDDLAEGFH
jgi:hypothetical protein